MKKSLLTNSLTLSIGLHALLVVAFYGIWALHPASTTQELTFKVIEKFVVDKEVKAPVVIKAPVKPVPPPVVKKKQVYGISRKTITSSVSSQTVKAGNTVAKTPDDTQLKKEDEDALPIPADEFMISAMPQVLEEVRPSYPQEAKQKGIEGKVIFEILIDQLGVVRQVSLVKSLDPILDQAAREAIMRFKFRPAKMGDQKVAVKIKYAINFVLEK